MFPAFSSWYARKSQIPSYREGSQSPEMGVQTPRLTSENLSICSQDLWSSNLHTIPFRLDMSSQLTLLLFAISLIFRLKHAADFLKGLNESKLLSASVIKPLLWTFYLIRLIICNIHSPSTLSETPVHLQFHTIIKSCGSKEMHKMTCTYRPRASFNVHMKLQNAGKKGFQ